MTAAGSGLQVFHDEALLGMSLPEAAPVTEALVHVKVYPNRPDCLGLIGIAREVAAMLGLTLVLPGSACIPRRRPMRPFRWKFSTRRCARATPAR